MQARAHLDEVTRDAADPTISARRMAARQRGAEQRLERLEAALAQVAEVTATKLRSRAKDATVRESENTLARARVMGDGGFRPAFNLQFATTTDAARVIVGVAVTNRGSDMAESTLAGARVIEVRTGVRPTEVLLDGGYAQHDAIDAATAQHVTVFAPVPKPRAGDARDPHVARAGDSAAVAAWRERMGTDDAKQIYKQRAATAETVNADAKTHRGLDHVPVRGLAKALGSATLFALTYNILRVIALRG